MVVPPYEATSSCWTVFSNLVSDSSQYPPHSYLYHYQNSYSHHCKVNLQAHHHNICFHHPLKELIITNSSSRSFSGSSKLLFLLWTSQLYCLQVTILQQVSGPEFRARNSGRIIRQTAMDPTTITTVVFQPSSNFTDRGWNTFSNC